MRLFPIKTIEFYLIKAKKKKDNDKNIGVIRTSKQ